MLYAFDSSIKEEIKIGGHGKYRPYIFFKRTLDVIFSLIAILFFLPFFIAIATLLSIHDGWPVIYRHKRIGRNGKAFDCFKFRTMRRDADRVLSDLLRTDAGARLEWDLQQKLRNDPRIHPVGRFLRISSLDELPQFFNVLRGDMSIVGPRPIVEDEIPRYGERIHDYLSMTPGITGLWQVSGRSETSYQYRVDLDSQYRETCSLLLDLKIICRTVTVVLFDHNGC
ncbi:sugar transferase [Nitratireductor soli]|uniref:sugar transferase n=1 Tax=Nitratireductor soli TaxID=1670619 RepID=UPI00065E39DC|nr:sugar transferase [Nitratireductor soli]